MRLVHSFNTRPLSIDCYGVDSLRRMAGNIWYYALSVAYAKAAGAGARVKLILPGDTGHGQAATRIGYQHVVTSRKFELLDKCRAALLAISPEIHEKTSRICRNISRE